MKKLICVLVIMAAAAFIPRASFSTVIGNVGNAGKIPAITLDEETMNKFAACDAINNACLGEVDTVPPGLKQIWRDICSQIFEKCMAAKGPSVALGQKIEVVPVEILDAKDAIRNFCIDGMCDAAPKCDDDEDKCLWVDGTGDGSPANDVIETKGGGETGAAIESDGGCSLVAQASPDPMVIIMIGAAFFVLTVIRKMEDL